MPANGESWIRNVNILGILSYFAIWIPFIGSDLVFTYRNSVQILYPMLVLLFLQWKLCDNRLPKSSQYCFPESEKHDSGVGVLVLRILKYKLKDTLNSAYPAMLITSKISVLVEEINLRLWIRWISWILRSILVYIYNFATFQDSLFSLESGTYV